MQVDIDLFLHNLLPYHVLQHTQYYYYPLNWKTVHLFAKTLIKYYKTHYNLYYISFINTSELYKGMECIQRNFSYFVFDRFHPTILLYYYHSLLDNAPKGVLSKREMIYLPLMWLHVTYYSGRMCLQVYLDVW